MSTFPQLTELTVAPDDADEFLIRDVSAGADLRAQFDTLFGSSARANTGTAPEDVPLNSDASGLTWPDESTEQEWQLALIDGDLVIREVD